MVNLKAAGLLASNLQQGHLLVICGVHSYPLPIWTPMQALCQDPAKPSMKSVMAGDIQV